MRKPHAKSVLKTLPLDRQREIYDYIHGTKDAPGHSYEETEAWLLTAGIETNLDSIGKFYHWFPLASQLHAASSMGDAVKEILREIPGLDLDEQQLSKAGQAIFEADALKRGDSKLYLSLRQLRQTDRSLDLSELSGKTKARQKDKQLTQKDRDLKLAERRVAVLEKKFQDAANTLSDPALSMPEREARMKEMFGIS